MPSAPVEGGVHIISTPVHFEWKGNRFEGLTEDDVHVLNPDMFVIIFDDVVRVRDRLAEDTQWQDHKYTLGEIANMSSLAIYACWSGRGLSFH